MIDTDTHVTEPPDVWTARVPVRWRDRVPRVERVDGVDLWFVGDEPIGTPGAYSMAGHDDYIPNFPRTYDDIPPAAFDAGARLAHMDTEGIWAQVLYPNVGGFGSGRFLELGDPELMLACVRAYNDWLLEWSAADPQRLIPVMATPFWDVDASVAEIERCAALGYRAVLHCAQPDNFGQPRLPDRHWDPIWAAVQDAGLSISFHVGGGSMGELLDDRSGLGWRTNFARVSSLIMLDNQRCLADLIFGGVCHRFPDLRLVSVESGAGWLPPVLETFDWQWQGSGVRREHPEYDLLPSEYFRRQIFGCFWFEEVGLRTAIEQFGDNLLYETDFPHPTCQAPGPCSPGRHPREYANEALAGLDDAVVAKVLHDNAARLYGLGR